MLNYGSLVVRRQLFEQLLMVGSLLKVPSSTNRLMICDPQYHAPRHTLIVFHGEFGYKNHKKNFYLVILKNMVAEFP